MPRRSFAAAVLVALAVSSTGLLPATAAPPRVGAPGVARTRVAPTATTPRPVDLATATAFLLSKQQADGGFEAAGSPLFETPDAIFALAARAQTGPTWDAAAARAAVEAHAVGGKNPLTYVDAQVDGEAVPAHGSPAEIALAARTAKLVALVAGPLGISASVFDPDGDAHPVDLWARIDAVKAQDGTYGMPGQLNGVLYVALAKWATGQAVPAALIAQIKVAQRSDGSWLYSGSTTTPGTDIDTTALALIALRRAGLGLTDPAVAGGVGFLAAQQDAATGGWSSFGSLDPNSTSMATMALSAVGVDVTSPTWRSAAGFAGSGAPTASPLLWLGSQQATDGRIASPNDGFGVTTFATTQSLQAVSRVRYTAPERDAFVARAAAVLTTKWTVAPGSPSAGSLALVSDALGPNPSVTAGRRSAVLAALGSDASRRATADELFERALGRPTDPTGETYWAGRLRTISRQQMIAELVASPELYAKAGGTNAAFVNRAYQVVFFGRSADSGGLSYWVGRLAAGTPREAVALALLGSGEYRQKEVGAQYQRLLDRPVDPGGRGDWADRLRTDRIEVLVASLMSSGELYRKAIG